MADGKKADRLIETFGNLAGYAQQGYGPDEFLNIINEGEPYPSNLYEDIQYTPMDMDWNNPNLADDMVNEILNEASMNPVVPNNDFKMDSALRTLNRFRDLSAGGSILYKDELGQIHTDQTVAAHTSPGLPSPFDPLDEDEIIKLIADRYEGISEQDLELAVNTSDRAIAQDKKEASFDTSSPEYAESQRDTDRLRAASQPVDANNVFAAEEPRVNPGAIPTVEDMQQLLITEEALAEQEPMSMSQRQAFQEYQDTGPSFEGTTMYQQPMGMEETMLSPHMTQEMRDRLDPISPEESLLHQRFPAFSPGMQDVIQRGLLTPGELTQGMPVEESETYPGGMSPSLQQALIDVYKERGGTDTLPMERDDLFRREFEGTEAETLKQEEEDARKDFQGDQKAVAKVQGALGQTSTQQTGYKDIAESPIYNIEPAQLKNLINTAQPSLQDTGEGQWMFFGKVPGAPAYDGYFSPSENKVYAVEPETQIVRDLGTASLKQGKTESTISFGNRSISQPFGQTAWMPGTGTETPRPNVIGKDITGGADVLDTFDNSYSGLRNFYKAARTQSMGENLRNPQFAGTEMRGFKPRYGNFVLANLAGGPGKVSTFSDFLKQRGEDYRVSDADRKIAIDKLISSSESLASTGVTDNMFLQTLLGDPSESGYRQNLATVVTTAMGANPDSYYGDAVYNSVLNDADLYASRAAGTGAHVGGWVKDFLGDRVSS